MRRHFEFHQAGNVGWLRAAVLGANDGIISTASLILGVASAGATHKVIILTGIAGLLSGALSMASGEYVSVKSQLDTENSDIEKERLELLAFPRHEHVELTQIYINRGLSAELAGQVATQLMDKDALKAHTRDELGITEIMTAKPLLAAGSSALSFTIGAILPLLMAALVGMDYLIFFVSISGLLSLLFLGIVSAYFGGANIIRSSFRVVFWGVISMALTSLSGRILGLVF